MKTVFLLLLTITAIGVGQAQVTSIASGSWDSTATWSTGLIPGVNDSVIINGHTITLESSQVISDLTMINGVLTGDDDLTVSNSLDWNAGHLAGNGTITIEGRSTLEGTSYQLSRTLILGGGGSWTAGTLNIHTDGLFSVSPGSMFSIVNAGPLTVTNTTGGTGNFHIEGTLTKSGAGTLTFGNVIDYENSGNTEITGGKILLSNPAGSTHTGSLAISAGATLEMTSGTHTISGKFY